MNVPFDDTQALFNQVAWRDGLSPWTGSQNANEHRVTNLADPTNSGDSANKGYVDTAITEATTPLQQNNRRIVSLATGRNVVAADKATSFLVTAPVTITLVPAATLGANFWFEVWATNGNVTIDPDGAELINGSATLIVQTGQKAVIFDTGTQFYAVITGDSLSGTQLQGYSFGLSLTANVSDAANDVDITSGKAASDLSPFSLMQLSSAITKRIDAAWVAGTNQGGFDTGSVGTDGTYYIWLIQRSDTLVGDVLFSVSSSAPTLPANYDKKRLIGSLIRAASVNAAPTKVVPFDIQVPNLKDIYPGTWQVVTRTAGQVYQNDTGKWLPVVVDFGSNAQTVQLANNSSMTSPVTFGGTSGTWGVSVDIPPSWYYRISGANITKEAR